jgi:hypothetical protein
MKRSHLTLNFIGSSEGGGWVLRCDDDPFFLFGLGSFFGLGAPFQPSTPPQLCSTTFFRAGQLTVKQRRKSQQFVFQDGVLFSDQNTKILSWEVNGDEFTITRRPPIERQNITSPTLLSLICCCYWALG